MKDMLEVLIISKIERHRYTDFCLYIFITI